MGRVLALLVVLLLTLPATPAAAASRADEEAGLAEGYINQVLKPLMNCFIQGFNGVNGIQSTRDAQFADQRLQSCYTSSPQARPPTIDGEGPGFRSELLSLLSQLRQGVAGIGRAADALQQFKATSRLSRDKPAMHIPSPYEQELDRYQVNLQNAKTLTVNLGADFRTLEGRFQQWVARLRAAIKKMKEDEFARDRPQGR